MAGSGRLPVPRRAKHPDGDAGSQISGEELKTYFFATRGKKGEGSSRTANAKQDLCTRHPLVLVVAWNE